MGPGLGPPPGPSAEGGRTGDWVLATTPPASGSVMAAAAEGRRGMPDPFKRQIPPAGCCAGCCCCCYGAAQLGLLSCCWTALPACLCTLSTARGCQKSLHVCGATNERHEACVGPPYGERARICSHSSSRKEQCPRLCDMGVGFSDSRHATETDLAGSRGKVERAATAEFVENPPGVPHRNRS